MERDLERCRGLSLRPSFSLSRGRAFSSFCTAASGNASFASCAESGLTSFTTSLVEEASCMSGWGWALCDWSGSGRGSCRFLGGAGGGEAATGLGLRRGERE